MKKGTENSMKVIETKEEDDKVLPFKPKLITGGKGPPSDNWLVDLKVGCVFLCKNKQPGAFALAQFHVEQKIENAIMLMSNLHNGPEEFIWVDPTNFCNVYKLVAKLYEPDEE